MKKNFFVVLALALSASMLLAGCSTQVGKTTGSESGEGTKKETEAKKEEDGKSSFEAAEEKGSQASALSSAEIEHHPLELTAEEEEAWKKEPAYGKTIRIGYNGGLCLGAFGIAQEEGFYEAEGLKTEITKMTVQSDAIGTGKVDVTGDHIAALLVPATKGVNMVFTRGCHSGCKSLYVLGSSEIQSTADLKGKTIAIADGIGGSDHNISLRFLSKDHIDPSEVQFKVVSYDAVILALQNGEVQGATLSDQFARKFVDDGTLRMIRSLTTDEDFKTEPCCIHAVNGDFLRENPITVKKLTHAHEEASKWIQSHKEEFVDIMLKMNWASGERDKVLDFADSLDFDIPDENTEKTLESIIDDYKGFGLVDKDSDTKSVLNKIWDPVLEQS